MLPPPAVSVHVCLPCRKLMQENQMPNHAPCLFMCACPAETLCKKVKRQKQCAMLHTAVQVSGLMGRLDADDTAMDGGKHPHYTPYPILDGKPHGGLNIPVLRSHAVTANTSQP